MTSRRTRDTATPTVPAPVAGAGRVFQQGGVLFALIELLTAFGLLHLDGRQYAAVLTVGTPLVGFAQEMIENRFGRAWLRSLPDSPAQVPVVTDDAGHVLTCVLALALVLIVLGALLTSGPR